MRFKLTWFCLIGILVPLNAHDAHQAFFGIRETELKLINIKADFPWTLREALIQFDSNLLVDKQEEVWRSALERYIIQNFIVYNSNGIPLKFLSIEESTSSHGGHAIQYNFSLEWGEIGEIENRLMFNINEDQENYHKISGNQGDIEFVTTTNNPNYIFDQSKKTIFYFIVSVFAGIFLCLFLLQTKISIKNKI